MQRNLRRERSEDAISATLLADANQRVQVYLLSGLGSEVVEDLRVSGFTLGGSRVDASILFCDIRGFTAISEKQRPEETIELLNHYYTLMFGAIDSHGGIVSLMAGDGLMALFGTPKPLHAPARSAVAAAREMLDQVAQLQFQVAQAVLFHLVDLFQVEDLPFLLIQEPDPVYDQ